MVTNMGEVKVWEEKVKIPTYEIGEPQKNPIFWRREYIREAVVRFILILPLIRSVM